MVSERMNGGSGSASRRSLRPLQSFSKTLSLHLFFFSLRSIGVYLADSRVHQKRLARVRRRLSLPSHFDMVFRKISKDMKERALSLYSQGYLPKDLCHIFGFSEKSLRRWKRNVQEHGSVIVPSSHRQGRPRKLNSDQIGDLMAQLLVEPDMYLDEIQTWVAISHDIGIAKSSLSKLIEDVGFSYKYLHKAATERDEDEREEFREWARKTLVPEMIVAIDESSKDDRTLYRRWGRSPSGMPATIDAQFVRGERYSLLAAMSVNGYVSTRVVEGSVDTAEFFDFVVGEVVSLLLRCVVLI